MKNYKSSENENKVSYVLPVVKRIRTSPLFNFPPIIGSEATKEEIDKIKQKQNEKYEFSLEELSKQLPDSDYIVEDVLENLLPRGACPFPIAVPTAYVKFLKKKEGFND